MMVPPVSPATLESMVGLVEKVSNNIIPYTHTVSSYDSSIHPLTHVFGSPGLPGDSFGYPGAAGARGRPGDPGFPGMYLLNMVVVFLE